MPIIDSGDLLKEYERTGCAHTFEKIVAEHRPYVLSICSRITGNAHDAEDGTQAVFLTLSLQARGGNCIHSLRPWLAQVARHVSLDLCKARKRRLNHEQAAMRGEVQPTGRSAVDEKELQQIIRRQIESLPPRYRTPMILFYFGGMSLPDIGKQLGVNRKALSVRLLRARRMLAQQLTQSSYPWFSVAVVPILLEEAVRQGMLDLTSAAAVPHGRLVASLTPAFFNFGLPVGIKRNIAISTMAIAALSSVAGSASIAWYKGEFPASIQLPSFTEWLGKKLNHLSNFSLPMRVQEVPKPDPKKSATVAKVYYPPVAMPLRDAPIKNIPLPQQLAAGNPKVFRGPDIPLSLKPSPFNKIVSGNISSQPNQAVEQIARSHQSTRDLPGIASASNPHRQDEAKTEAPQELASAGLPLIKGAGSDSFTSLPGEISFNGAGSVSVVGSGLEFDKEYSNNLSSAGVSGGDGSILTTREGYLDQYQIFPPNYGIDLSGMTPIIPEATESVDSSSVTTGVPGVPEPTIFGIFGVSIAILGARRRRHRNS